MEEQVCPYCELANAYVEEVIHSKTDEELHDILHDLIDEVALLTQLNVINQQKEALNYAEYKILNELEG